MAAIQIILQGARVATYDLYDYPIILQFGEHKTYDRAEWFIPVSGMRIPTWRLSEIRSHQGSFSVLVDGPEGFRVGPYPTTWVRHYYPRGKDCAFIFMDRETGAQSGVVLSVAEGSLFIDEFDGTPSAPSGG